jgi:hypothetical protein
MMTVASSHQLRLACIATSEGRELVARAVGHIKPQRDCRIAGFHLSAGRHELDYAEFIELRAIDSVLVRVSLETTDWSINTVGNTRLLS